MNQRTSKRLILQRETLRRLAEGDLERVAGGYIARCTYEKSGCYGGDGTDNCTSYGCTGGGDDSNYCLI